MQHSSLFEPQDKYNFPRKVFFHLPLQTRLGPLECASTVFFEILTSLAHCLSFLRTEIMAFCFYYKGRYIATQLELNKYLSNE